MPPCTTTAYPRWAILSATAPTIAVLSVPAALICAWVYGLPVHAVVGLAVVGLATGLGVTVGLHRLLTHRSFKTFRSVEWVLMILGAASGQSSPFFWAATHRRHHRFSDQAGDPHSPHVGAEPQWSQWRKFWHAHQGWMLGWARYHPADVNDLCRRPDLVWLDRHWFVWYLLGLALPAAAGFAVGGTAYDALMGFLWGGLLRQSVTQQGTYAINSLGHLWGRQDFDTGERSRNSPLLGVLALGEGWHNNHHAHPYSARLGLRWWQLDGGWCLIWLLERVGLVWRVKRPKRCPHTPTVGAVALAEVVIAHPELTHR